MAGSRESAQQTAATNKQKYGHDYYVRIGSLGGKKSRTGGFYGRPDLARIAGAIGGRKSRPAPGPPRLCVVGGCGRKHRGLGLCNMHYLRRKSQLKREANAAAAAQHDV